MLSRRAYLMLLLGDISVLYLSVWITLVVRHFSFPDVAYAQIHLTSFTLLFIPWFLVYLLLGLYGRYTVLFRQQLPNTIFIAQCINVCIAALFFFLIPFFAITPKLVLAIYLLVSTVCLYIWRIHMFPHIHIRREIGAVLVGTGQELTDLAEEVNTDPLYPLEFRAIIHPELSSEEEIRRTLILLIESGSISTIVADMSNHSIDKLLRFVYDQTFIERNAFFIDVRNLYQEVFQRVPLSLIDERWLLSSMSLDPLPLYATTKRIFDIVGAVVVGVPSLILYPFIAVLIKMDTRGPVFYSTHRIGRGGVPFRFIKFRTMTGTDVGTDVLASRHRVTRVGAFLRRTRLDELPQIWSVLIGNMSFIGPRPELPALVAEYRSSVSYYNLRHAVKPGVSGWAQINHHNHAHHAVDAESTEEKLAYDLFYIKERSIWLDLYTAILTLRTILFHRGS